MTSLPEITSQRIPNTEAHAQKIALECLTDALAKVLFSVIKMASDNKVSSETSDKLVAKLSRVKSVVWGYFGFKLDAEGKAKLQDFLICPLCKVSARGANSSNLFAHLKVHRPLKHAEVIQAKKASGKDRESSKAAYSGQTSLLTALRPAQKYNRKSKSGRNLRTQ